MTLRELAQVINLEGWTAIKSVPGVLETVTKIVGIVENDGGDVDDEIYDSLIDKLSVATGEECEVSVYVLAAISPICRFQSKALSAISRVLKIAPLAKNQVDKIWEFINQPIFVNSQEGLDYLLAVRMFSLIQDKLYGIPEYFYRALYYWYSSFSTGKQVLFMLKQLIATKKFGSESVLMVSDKCRLDEWAENWSIFFLLFETFQEPQSHLLEPLFPLLLNFLQEDSNQTMGLSWWKLVVNRGLKNTSVSVKKRVLEYVIFDLAIKDFPVLSRDQMFIFGPILVAIDDSSLYSAIDFNRLVSPFGLAVCQFYSNYLNLVDDEEERGQRIVLYLSHLETILSNMALIFLLKSILDSKPIPNLLSEEHLKKLSVLAGHKGFHNAKARSMLRCQLLELLISFSKSSCFDIFVLLPCLRLLLADVDQSNLIDRVSVWFCDRDNVEEQWKALFINFFSESQDFGFDRLSNDAKNLSYAAALLIRTGNLGKICSEILLIHINNSIDSFHVGLTIKCLLMIQTLEYAVKSLDRETFFLRGLLLPQKWFTLLNFLESMYFPSPSDKNQRQEISDFPPSFLITGLQSMVNELSYYGRSDPNIERMLVEYVDILLIKSIEWLDFFEQKDGDSTYDQQQFKVILCGIILMSMDTFNSLEYPSNGKQFNSNLLVAKLMKLELEKFEQFSDAQWEEWPNLANMFSQYKWRAIASYTKHKSTICQDKVAELDDIFCMAVKLVPSSQYNASIEIINCLKLLLCIYARSKSKDEVIAQIDVVYSAFKGFLFEMEGEKSKWYNIYAAAIIDCLYQTDLLTIPEMHSEDGPLMSCFVFLMNTIGPTRRGLLPHLLLHLYPSLKNDPVLRRSYLPVMPDILMYGSVRNIPEERLAEGLESISIN